jgi:hypothetical protein
MEYRKEQNNCFLYNNKPISVIFYRSLLTIEGLVFPLLQFIRYQKEIRQKIIRFPLDK